ncbi:zinc-binding dehydrogenase [Sphingobacterium psychroaquaticum]|uniref:alcohol dehydrogenase n=1 Tax=Sphingobacterium psychroaquaticum TaxID=561061 RepID=A0A1X7JBN0_9SPHI|nr:zinc-binding dehydrogenase [Sphingobacterium psychroaquaticum]SMG24948.1 putative phosphonate catabolism associated alcohol dehydrogenase [Sphingobacterium psychroaquaticum]
METTGTYYVFDRANTPLRKQITTLPSLADSEILVRISYAALCGSDLHTYCGLRQEPCPTILGHEIVGTIAAISPTHPGKDARGVPLKVGDLITWTVFSSDPNSKEYQTETPQKNSNIYKYGHRQITETDNFHGGLATHIILRKYTYIRILPSDFPQAIAATINCAIATSAGAIRLAGSLSGKTVHVAGIGLLGLTTIAMCKELGADVIIASDIDENRLTLAKEFGATHTVNNKLSDPSPLFSEHPVDRFIDMSGSPQAMENGVDSLTLYGRAVFVGAVFKQPKIGISAEQVIRKMLTIQGLHNYNYADFDFAVDFILAHVKKYPFASLIEQDFPLDEANEAFHFALQKKPIRTGIYIPKAQ